MMNPSQSTAGLTLNTLQVVFLGLPGIRIYLATLQSRKFATVVLTDTLIVLADN